MAWRREHRSGVATAAALGLHILLLFGASRLTDVSSPARLRHGLSALRSEAEVDLVDRASEDARDSEEDGRGERVASLAPERGAASRPSVESPGPGPELEPPGSVEPAPTERGEGPPSRHFTLEELGIGSSAPLLRGRERERTAKPAETAARRVERSFAEGFAKHDREIGLGSDGPVISALEKAVYGSSLPGNGNALFVARIDSSGRLSFLDVLETNGDHAGWTAVAEHAVSALGKKKLRLPSGSRGIELEIRVSTREVMPSGADPGLEVSLLDVPLQKGRGKRSAKLSLLGIQWLEFTLPDGKKVRIPVGINPLAGAGDVSDIGSNPRRVVHARVESQRIL